MEGALAAKYTCTVSRSPVVIVTMAMTLQSTG